MQRRPEHGYPVPVASRLLALPAALLDSGARAAFPLARLGSFQETNAELASIVPLLIRDRLPVADRLAEEREQPALADAVVTGTGAIDGSPAVLIALDLAIFGAGVGIVAGEKIALAMELAVTRRLPVVAICSAGAGRSREGVLALAQIGKLAVSAARLRRVGVPLIAILTHPTAGNLVVGLVNQADFRFAEPGSQIGLDTGPSPMHASPITAEELVSGGAIDGVLDRINQRTELGMLLGLLGERHRNGSPTPEDEPADGLLQRVASPFSELRGDRVGADHPLVHGGIGRIGTTTAVAIELRRGDQELTDSAFAKVNRLLRLAAHLELPVVTFVDRAAGGSPTAGGSGLLMAQTLALLTAIPVPIVNVVTGEASGLAAMTFLTADRVLMREQAVISLSTGEQVASARQCLQLGIADQILPAGGSEASLVEAIGSALDTLAGTGSRRLIDDRTRRLRQTGLGTAEGVAAAHVEWRELQELQAAVGRSVGDLRRRWEHRQLSLPSVANRPSLPFTIRPGLPAINLPKFSIRRPDLGELATRVAAGRRGTAMKELGERKETGEPNNHA